MQHGHGLDESMSRAVPVQLGDPVAVYPRQGFTHLSVARPLHDTDPRGPEFLGGSEDVAQEGPTGQAMQNLGQIGLHAGALPGGEDGDA